MRRCVSLAQKTRWLNVRPKVTLPGSSQCADVISEKRKTEFVDFPEISFDNNRLAYRSKTTREILRSLLVLGFCRYGFLVDHSEKFVKIARRLLDSNLFNKLMKATFFGQFVAGENDEEIRPLIERLRKFRVSIILNYAVEDDEEGGDQEKSGLIKHGDKQRKDPREQNMHSFIKTIDRMAEVTRGEGFAAIKVTALSRPDTLMTVTNAIRNSQTFVNNLVNETFLQRPIIGRGLSKSDLGKNLLQKGNGVEEKSLLKWMEILETDEDNVIDTIRWSRVFDGNFGLSDISLLPNSAPKFSQSEEAELTNLVRRMDTIAKHAHQTNMRVLVDAEQSYFQPAIARLSLELMRKYNQDRPSIYNTYQCYLKETFENVTAHLELARKENFMFGAKIVRGAYIVLEQQRALDMGYPDPINPTFEATTDMYKKVVSYVMDDIKSRGNKSHSVIAGHNEETVKWAVKQFEKSGLPRTTRQIYFGQLLGMCDQLSFTLADAGYNVVKCVPYGTVEEVLPYLIRRAHENRGVMEKTQNERKLLRRELFRRMKDGDLNHNPDDIVHASTA